jgi:hypothetical protein
MGSVNGGRVDDGPSLHVGHPVGAVPIGSKRNVPKGMHQAAPPRVDWQLVIQTSFVST